MQRPPFGGLAPCHRSGRGDLCQRVAPTIDGVKSVEASEGGSPCPKRSSSQRGAQAVGFSPSRPFTSKTDSSRYRIGPFFGRG
jgi:hypothetical protein